MQFSSNVSLTCSITSVFFGGGTPSLADPSTISAVLETVSKQASLSDQAEVTLEVNPTPAGKMKLEEFHLAGANRFSIGVQVNIISGFPSVVVDAGFDKLCFIFSLYETRT